MSIAEKLTTIAENQQRVYDAGYSAGQGAGGDTSIEDSIIDRSITEYRNDRLTYIGSSAFMGANKLVSVDLPNVETTAGYAFQNCTALTSVNLPKATMLGNGVVNGCTSLLSIDLPLVNDIYSYAFSGSSKLEKVILRSETVARLRGVAFSNTPIADGTGYIYVPDNLVDSYKVATNWTTVASQIKPLSELEG